MRAKHIFAALFLLFLSICQAGAKELSAQDILDYVDDLYRGKSSSGKMTMTITTAFWQRALSIEFWNKGKEKSLIRIAAPQKEKGTTTLRSGNDMWNFLPKVKKIIKLPSSMMSASWMGSHFTNDDLVKESRFTDDFTFEITAKKEEKGRTVVEITCMPKPEAAVVWGKVLVYAFLDDYMPIKSLYYDEDMKLARTMIFSDIGASGTNRRLPKALTIFPADKPKEKTVVHYDEIRYDTEISDDFFSLRTLQH